MNAFGEFNINHPVRVKLTEMGLARFREIRERLNADIPPESSVSFSTTPKLDAEGYYSASMWSIMQDFGDLIGLSMPLPFETTIKLERKHLA